MAFARGAALPGFGTVPRVNLLPRSELDRRERAVLLRRWLAGVAMAVVVVVAASAGTYALNVLAGHSLAVENARTTDLLGTLAGLSDVSRIRAVQKELESYRTEAMGTDVAWAPVFDTFERLVPENAEITGWDLTTGALPGEGDPAEQTGVTGTLTLTSTTPVDLVATVRGIRAADGVVDADAVDLTGAVADGEKPTYTYQLSATLDQTVYTGRYAKKEK